MPPRPHDALFKSAFEAPAHAAALLRELLPAAIRDAIAWDTVKGESGSFVDPALTRGHSDLLFSARFRTPNGSLVFLLLEHQSTDDPAMPLRTMVYQTRIWDRFRKGYPAAPLPPVIAVVVSHGPGGWTSSRALDDMFDPWVLAIPGLTDLIPLFSLIIDDIAHQSNQDLRSRSLAAYQKLALWLLRDGRDPARLLESFDAWIWAMLEVEGAPGGVDALATLLIYMFRVIAPMHLELLRAKLRQLGARAEKAAMTIAELLHEEGRIEGLNEGRNEGLNEGRNEGRIEGLNEGRIVTLRSLLAFKFKLQTLEAGYEARLRGATPETIDRYLQRVLTADSLAEVFED